MKAEEYPSFGRYFGELKFASYSSLVSSGGIMATNGTSKRRRTATDALHITDLPVGILVDVSTYLSKPSRAIFASAITAPSSSWKNDNLMHRLSDRSSAIISPLQWDVLDFEDVSKELANKLTDDDIYAILKCICAQDVLKRLKLCGCINIEGHGLKPLMGSVVLEQIDISLVGKHEKQKIEPKQRISLEAIVFVLDSIFLQFPAQWHTDNKPPKDQISLALMEFRQRHVCEDCSIGEEDLGDGDIFTRDLFLKFCDNCEKDYCKDCFIPPRGYEETEYCGVCRRPCYDCSSENGVER